MSETSNSMQGKICVVTGANSGIGKETALGLAKMGATVVMVCRNQAKGEAAKKEIQAESGNTAVDLMIVDLSSQASIRRFAEQFKQRYSQLHALINNAGVFNLSRRETVDTLEMTFAVNQLAPFLLTDLLLDVIKASAPARIVNVNSEAHEAGYINVEDLQSKKNYKPMRTYGQSKLAMLLYSYELARRLQNENVTVNCLHPGFVATNIAQGNLPAAVRVVVRFLLSFVGISPQEGAKTSIYLASSPDVEGVTGKYFVKSVPKRSASISYDEALQQEVWDASATLVAQEMPRVAQISEIE